jgi:intracellular multiplication protein IcmK
MLPDIDEAAFKQIQSNAAPLSPDQIRALRRIVDDAERAASMQPRFTPKPVSTAVTANLAPGRQPPVVRLWDSYVTSVLFIDAAGNPLPIVTADRMKGSFFIFEVEPGSNVLKLSPETTYATGNISVSLKGVSAPVVLTLISGQREVDYRVDVRVTGGNVSARLATQGASAAQLSQTMLEFLSGGIPEGARALSTDSADVQAWAFNGHYYVRTALTLLSPAYTNPGKSSDGTSFYEIPPTPVLVVSAAGAPKHVNVEGP